MLTAHCVCDQQKDLPMMGVDGGQDFRDGYHMPFTVVVMWEKRD